MTGVLSGASLKTYNNSKVQSWSKNKPKQHIGYVKWVEMSIQKQIDKLKVLKEKKNIKIYKKSI